MLITIIISSLLVIVFYYLWKYKKVKATSKVTFITEQTLPIKEQQLQFINEAVVIDSFSVPDKMYANIWWTKLSLLEQLQLALALCEKALPVWEKYTAITEVVYKNSATGKLNKIDNKILRLAIEEIMLYAKSQFPDKDNKKINHCYSNFISIVLAIQDAVWQPPYTIKKIFMAVYNILKSIIEQNDSATTNSFLSQAISQALDCIDITKSYSRLEVDEFLEGYKNKL